VNGEQARTLIEDGCIGGAEGTNMG